MAPIHGWPTLSLQSRSRPTSKEVIMSRLVITLVLVVALGLGAWAFAQKLSGVGAPIFGRPAPAPPGLFQVTPSGDSVFLVDANSGKTWRFESGGRGVWLPVKRLDKEEEAQQW